MIVIAKVLAVTEQSNDDDRGDIDDIDLSVREDQEEQKQEERESGPKTFLCEAMVEQLVAFSDLQFTVYNHIYS